MKVFRIILHVIISLGLLFFMLGSAVSLTDTAGDSTLVVVYARTIGVISPIAIFLLSVGVGDCDNYEDFDWPGPVILAMKIITFALTAAAVIIPAVYVFAGWWEEIFVLNGESWAIEPSMIAMYYTCPFCVLITFFFAYSEPDGVRGTLAPLFGFIIPLILFLIVFNVIPAALYIFLEKVIIGLLIIGLIVYGIMFIGGCILGLFL